MANRRPRDSIPRTKLVLNDFQRWCDVVVALVDITFHTSPLIDWSYDLIYLWLVWVNLIELTCCLPFSRLSNVANLVRNLLRELYSTFHKFQHMSQSYLERCSNRIPRRTEWIEYQNRDKSVALKRHFSPEVICPSFYRSRTCHWTGVVRGTFRSYSGEGALLPTALYQSVVYKVNTWTPRRWGVDPCHRDGHSVSQPSVQFSKSSRTWPCGLVSKLNVLEFFCRERKV